jgi:chromosome segregation ATPase
MMKTIYSVTILILLAFSTGCTTKSQVQGMIDGSRSDSLETAKAHESAINVLKQSSAKALEQNQAQEDMLVSLQKQLEAAQAQLKPVQGNAEAAKVMSAANTVKVAELSDSMLANQEAIDETVEKMNTVDQLFEEVLIAHFEMIAESADAAIATLQADDVATTDGAPAGLAEPIEIVAPDTSTNTNAVSESASTNAAPEQ